MPQLDGIFVYFVTLLLCFYILRKYLQMESKRAELDVFHAEVGRLILSRQHPATGLIPASVAKTTHGDYRGLVFVTQTRGCGTTCTRSWLCGRWLWRTGDSMTTRERRTSSNTPQSSACVGCWSAWCQPEANSDQPDCKD